VTAPPRLFRPRPSVRAAAGLARSTHPVRKNLLAGTTTRQKSGKEPRELPGSTLSPPRFAALRCLGDEELTSILTQLIRWAAVRGGRALPSAPVEQGQAQAERDEEPAGHPVEQAGDSVARPRVGRSTRFLGSGNVGYGNGFNSLSSSTRPTPSGADTRASVEGAPAFGVGAEGPVFPRQRRRPGRPPLRGTAPRCVPR
jgi:hypothetical protein